MKAVQIREHGTHFYLTDAAVPKISPNEVLVQVKASGLCLTDLHLLEGVQDIGPLPRIPGHEVSGIIAETGSGVTRWKQGQRVLLAIDVTCGCCEFCLAGETQRCRTLQRIGFERDGGHAEYVAVPESSLLLIPDELDFEETCIVPDAIGCMYHSLVTLGGLSCGQKTAILGAGGLGMHGIQLIRLMGSEVLATSRRSQRLEAAESLGAVAVNTATEDLTSRSYDFSGGKGLDIVADCVGTNESISQGLSMLKPGGRLLVLAYIDKTLAFESVPFFSREKQIIGCRGCTRQEIITVMDLMSRGSLSSIIGARYPLEQFIEAAEVLKQGNVTGRVVITHEKN